MVEEFRINPEFVPINNNDRSTQEKVVKLTWIYTVFQCICFRKYTSIRLMMLYINVQIENLVACKISRVQPEPEW
jgi:hypothetical protein